MGRASSGWLWRRCRLWRTVRYSTIALTSSLRVSVASAEAAGQAPRVRQSPMLAPMAFAATVVPIEVATCNAHLPAFAR